MNDAWSPATNTMAAAISSGTPSRPAGRLEASQRSCASGSGADWMARSTSGVRVVPGQTDTAVIVARAAGDEFGSSLWETDLDELRQLARAYGVAVPAA